MKGKTSDLDPKQVGCNGWTYHAEADTSQCCENSSVPLHEALSSQGYCTHL
jgi:hypothetical protein